MHGQKQWKMLENIQKITFLSCGWEAHVEAGQIDPTVIQCDKSTFLYTTPIV